MLQHIVRHAVGSHNAVAIPGVEGAAEHRQAEGVLNGRLRGRRAAVAFGHQLHDIISRRPNRADQGLHDRPLREDPELQHAAAAVEGADILLAVLRVHLQGHERHQVLEAADGLHHEPAAGQQRIRSGSPDSTSSEYKPSKL